MDIKKQFDVDYEAVEKGTWVNIEGGQFKIANTENVAFIKKMIETDFVGVTGADEQHKLMAKCMAGTVLLDWKGIEEDGAEVAFTAEKAEEYLLLPKFFNKVYSIASKDEAYLRHNVKKDIEAVKKP